MEKKAIQDKILRNLMSRGKWGGAHTEDTNLVKVLPKHLRGEKVTQKAIEELYKMDFILRKRSTGAIHVSLNSAKMKEIHTFLGLSEEEK